MKYLLLIILSFQLFSKEAQKSSEAFIAKAKVPAMVCQMCLFGIRKQFEPFVQDVKKDVVVDMDKKILTLRLKEKLADNKVMSLIEDAGYKTAKLSWVGIKKVIKSAVRKIAPKKKSK